MMVWRTRPSLDRWTAFGFGRQIQLIANELDRAVKLTRAEDRRRRLSSFERVYALVDLTLEANPRASRRRELLRWRESLGFSYLGAAPDPGRDRALLRSLLQLSPDAPPRTPLAAR